MSFCQIAYYAKRGALDNLAYRLSYGREVLDPICKYGSELSNRLIWSSCLWASNRCI